MLDIKSETLAAKTRIYSFVRETPLDYSIALSRLTGCQVYLKCENLQYTGSFKARGAINKLLSLSPSQCEQGIVAASSGNHGAAVAFGLRKLNINGIIFVPNNAAPTKIDNIRNYAVPLEFYGTDIRQTVLHARDYAKNHHSIYIPPYNDPQVIGGQGTIGLEISQQLDHVDAVFVPIGGGGLISGIAGYLKAVSPHVKMIGCLPMNSPIMAESVKAGQIIDREIKPSLSDATAGGIAPDTITFEICQQLIDDYILVSEDEIKKALIMLLNTQHLLVEGAAGVALASLLKHTSTFRNQNVVVVLSGANMSVDTLKNVLDITHLKKIEETK